jgi:hypothetical protein
MTMPRRRDDGSLPIAMLLVLVGTGLGALLMTTVLQANLNTRVERARTAALQGARTGIASALSGIRAARDPAGTGALTALPCATSAGTPQVTGSVDGSGVRYETTITYLAEDPTERDAGWIRAAGVPCATQLGVVPAYAYLEATGIDTASGQRRTLFGTYAFRTVRNANLPGGLIRVFRRNNVNDLCMDAGPAPAAGTTVTMQVCRTGADGAAIDRQKWAYQPNLTIALTTADLTAYPYGLCLDAGSPQKAGNVVKLQQCGSTTLPRQQWSFDDASGFDGTTDGRTINAFCLSVTSRDVPGSTITLNSTSGGNGNPACHTSYPNNDQSWSPTPQVGAGATGLPVTRQLANYAEFGRCFDVTYEDVSIPYEVVFPCKQTPDPAVRDWNQQWHLPEPGTTGAFYTDSPTGRYCVVLPRRDAPPPLLVTVTRCTGTLPTANMTWWVRGASTATYDEAYRIEGTGDWAGYCLTALAAYPAWEQADKVGIVACGGDNHQKWNAAPDHSPSGLSGIGER